MAKFKQNELSVITCPKCNKRGTLCVFTTGRKYYVRHKLKRIFGKKTYRKCIITNPAHDEIILTIVNKKKTKEERQKELKKERHILNNLSVVERLNMIKHNQAQAINMKKLKKDLHELYTRMTQFPNLRCGLSNTERQLIAEAVGVNRLVDEELKICPSCKRLGKVYLVSLLSNGKYYETYHENGVVCKYKKLNVDIQTSWKQRPWTACVETIK